MDSAVDRLLTLKIKDVMTRQVVCVGKDQTLSEAARLFVERRISGAPVVDDEGRCVGVLSATDYVHRERLLREDWSNDANAERVHQRMSAGARSVQAEQTLLTAARLMCEAHVHRLPVLDTDGKPVGLITSMDVAAALVNAIEERETRSM